MPTHDKFKRTKRQYPDLSEGDASNVVQAEDKFVEWFSDPEVRKRFPGTDEELDQGIQKALDTKVQTAGFYNQRHRASFDQAYEIDGEKFPGTIRTSTTEGDVLQHEFTHAAEFDNSIGVQLGEVLGEAPNRYLKNPGELYGNFHQLRVKLGIKPWERSFTPAKLLELIQFQGLEKDEDVQTYLKSFGPEKMSEALNKIANVEADGRRLDRLNFAPDENVIMRPTNTYA